MSNSDYEKWESGGSPQKYTGLPVEAVRVDDDNIDDIVQWLEGKGFEVSNAEGTVSFGHTSADVGSWVVVTAANQLKTMDDVSFNEIYDGTQPPLAGA